MDCGGGSDFGGGHSSFGGGGCSSSGAHFGGSDFGDTNTSHNAHFTSTTHTTFASHPTSSTTHWTSTSVSGPRVQSTPAANRNDRLFMVVVFTCWFGVFGFMAYVAATYISPFWALPVIFFALLAFLWFAWSRYQYVKRQRGLGGGANVNQHTTTQSHVHPPPQQGLPPQSGYPSSHPTSQQPQWNPAYSTNYSANYGQQQYGMPGQQAPRPSAPPSGVLGENKPPSYDDVVKGGTVPLGFV